MKNNKLIDNKTLLRTCGFILGTYAIATIAIAANKIINYDKQDFYSEASLARAEKAAEHAINQYNLIYTELEQDSYKAICKSEDYLNLYSKASELKQQIRRCDPKGARHAILREQLCQVYDKMALMEDSLCRAYINSHPDMRAADRQLKHAKIHLERVHKDCKSLDSIKQVPTTQRIKSNWNKICADWRMIQNTKQK